MKGMAAGRVTTIASPPKPQFAPVQSWDPECSSACKVSSLVLAQRGLSSLGSDHSIVPIRFPVKEGPRHPESQFRKPHLLLEG